MGALIVTALLDAASQARFDRERQLHFPASINFLRAHVTLFHALPGENLDSVARTLADICSAHAPAPFETTGVRSLGRGVAYDLHMPDIVRLRERLATHWRDWLTPQDRQGFRPHITVQNKVSSDVAKSLLFALRAAYAHWCGEVQGLSLWRYENGPWMSLEDMRFRSQEEKVLLF